MPTATTPSSTTAAAPQDKPSFNLDNGFDRYDFLFLLQTFVAIASALVTLWNFRKVLIEAQVAEVAKKQLNENGKVIFVAAIVIVALLGVGLFYIFKKIQDSNREREAANLAVAAAATTAIAAATTQAAAAAQQSAVAATEAAQTANLAATTVAIQQSTPTILNR